MSSIKQANPFKTISKLKNFITSSKEQISHYNKIFIQNDDFLDPISREVLGLHWNFSKKKTFWKFIITFENSLIRKTGYSGRFKKDFWRIKHQQMVSRCSQKIQKWSTNLRSFESNSRHQWVWTTFSFDDGTFPFLPHVFCGSWCWFSTCYATTSKKM